MNIRIRNTSDKLKRASTRDFRPVVSTKYVTGMHVGGKVLVSGKMLGTEVHNRTQLQIVLQWVIDHEPELYSAYVLADSRMFHSLEHPKGKRVEHSSARLLEVYAAIEKVYAERKV